MTRHVLASSPDHKATPKMGVSRLGTRLLFADEINFELLSCWSQGSRETEFSRNVACAEDLNSSSGPILLIFAGEYSSYIVYTDWGGLSPLILMLGGAIAPPFRRLCMSLHN